MNLGLAIPSVIFGLVGAWIILYTIKIFLSAILGNPWDWFERQKVAKKERLLAAGDVFFQSKNFPQALESWKSAIYLDSLRHQPGLVETVLNLNLNVLSRLVSLSEKQGRHILNLARVEDLFATRGELMKTFCDTKNTLHKLRHRKKDTKSAGAPDWALQEFSKKHAEIKQKIAVNRDNLESELKCLFDSFSGLTAERQITYH